MSILQPDFALWGDAFQLNIGNEIVINDDFNTNLNYGWSGSGNSYELPGFVDDRGFLLINARSSGFFAFEIELYEVDGKNCFLILLRIKPGRLVFLI